MRLVRSGACVQGAPILRTVSVSGHSKPPRRQVEGRVRLEVCVNRRTSDVRHSSHLFARADRRWRVLVGRYRNTLFGQISTAHNFL